MTEETRQYIEEVVKTFETRFRGRGTNWNREDTNIRKWERRLYERAKIILATHPREHST